ncbi:DUF1328 domain-containing protein [Bosea caraganae]|nr:DUF1328 domain-containing protein [Bosea caraganae]
METGTFAGRQLFPKGSDSNVEGYPMAGWAVTFLIVALVAAMLAFGGVPGLAVSVARVMFAMALAAAALTGLIALLRKPR